MNDLSLPFTISRQDHKRSHVSLTARDTISTECLCRPSLARGEGRSILPAPPGGHGGLTVEHFRKKSSSQNFPYLHSLDPSISTMCVGLFVCFPESRNSWKFPSLDDTSQFEIFYVLPPGASIKTSNLKLLHYFCYHLDRNIKQLSQWGKCCNANVSTKCYSKTEDG